MLWTTDLAAAQHCAARADFSGCLARCQTLARAHANDPEALLSIGTLLLSAGLLSAAETCFARASTLAPRDARPWVNRANRAREAGEHARARQIMQALLEQFPNHPVIRRNALTSLEYDPAASDTERFAQARAWGQWAQTRAGGPHPRLLLVPRDSRPLRIGYISADICQHTVGLFIKDVLAAHDPARITPIVYHAGQVRDWVTQQISQSVQLREVSALDDAALVAQIRADHIDVLIDLSGHTAGSRLSVFAHRPAPVQVSWLGYFATTGLTEMDAVLLDAWHAPPGTESQFIEPILPLPAGRFCYQPVPWAPKDLSPPPVAHSARITFGSFNNTAKLNDGVYDLWAQIL
ncbi:O-linked N-acetylglucosamine transferase family protein, partial [Thiorhodovibrio frisius]